MALGHLVGVEAIRVENLWVRKVLLVPLDGKGRNLHFHTLRDDHVGVRNSIVLEGFPLQYRYGGVQTEGF